MLLIYIVIQSGISNNQGSKERTGDEEMMKGRGGQGTPSNSFTRVILLWRMPQEMPAIAA